jgi:conjugal transfer pilus assembly protein TraV
MPKHVIRGGALAFASGAALLLSGCATMGSLMSPYSEKFSCKNDDHGQCIHPERAYEDAVAGVTSKSDPAVTNDRKMLREPDLRVQSR